jgi:hypothetical protein
VHERNLAERKLERNFKRAARKRKHRYARKSSVEIATIAIVGAAVLGRLVLGRIVNRMLREVAGDLLKR